MNDEERRHLLYSDRFNYDLSPGKDVAFLSEGAKGARLQQYQIKHTFDIGLLGYIYGNRTLKMAQYYFFINYGNKIMASREGRGKSFRHFYEYVLGSSDRITLILRKKWLHLIPTETINYSNVVSTMYFMIKNDRISDVDIRRIALDYLGEVVLNSDGSIEMGEDEMLTQAILGWIQGQHVRD